MKINKISDKNKKQIEKPTICIGEYTVNELRNGKDVILDNVVLVRASDLSQQNEINILKQEKKEAENFNFITSIITLLLSIIIICLILIR